MSGRSAGSAAVAVKGGRGIGSRLRSAAVVVTGLLAVSGCATGGTVVPPGPAPLPPTYTNDSTVGLDGPCRIGDTVTMFIDGVPSASMVCSDGTYELTSPPLTSGQHTSGIEFTDSDGNPSSIPSPPATTWDVD